MMSPLVSVCVQTYNHCDYIKKCLDSILMQETGFQFEIVIGEDSSEDGTQEICLEYAQRFPGQIVLFLRDRKNVIFKNGRPTGRFNMMENLKAARGKYIAILEGDDYWTDPKKLQKQVDILENHPEYILCHHWQKHGVLENGEWIELIAPKEGHGYNPSTRTGLSEIFNNTVRIKSRTILFRNVIGNSFFPEWFSKVAYGDVPLSFLLGRYGDFYFIDEPMAVYRQTNTGSSTYGLESLGFRKLLIQQNKYWIEIWDYANYHYNYRYNFEARPIINQFLKNIVKYSDNSILNIFCVLWYNSFLRKASITRTLGNTKWLWSFYIMKLKIKIKEKVLNV